MSKYWLGVVSKEHVMRGVSGGFAQVCHGKKGPLSKMKTGDWLIYYSPKQSFGGNQPCRSFTAIGKIKTGNVYQVEMAPKFIPFRLDVAFLACTEVPVSKLMDELELTSDKRGWGMKLRRGLVELSEHDFTIIAQAMEYAVGKSGQLQNKVADLGQ